MTAGSILPSRDAGRSGELDPQGLERGVDVGPGVEDVRRQADTVEPLLLDHLHDHAMPVAQAIHLLHMHKHKVHGLGKAPGKRWQRPKTLAEVAPSIIAKWNAMLAAGELGEEQRARDEAEWALRRGSGQAQRRLASLAEPLHKPASDDILIQKREGLGHAVRGKG